METGIQHTGHFVVTEEQLAVNMGSGDLRVLSTPCLIAAMENAAMSTVAGHLPEGCTTVGGSMNMTHLRPSASGDTYTATATLTQCEGKKLTFGVTAQSNGETIGEGTHVRFIVDREKFMQRLSGR